MQMNSELSSIQMRIGDNARYTEKPLNHISIPSANMGQGQTTHVNVSFDIREGFWGKKSELEGMGGDLFRFTKRLSRSQSLGSTNKHVV